MCGTAQNIVQHSYCSLWEALDPARGRDEQRPHLQLGKVRAANARVGPCAEWAGDARGHLIPKLEDVSLRALEAVGSQLVPARLENWREN